ncbi:MAG: dCTP deaminase [Patescibacteria group bacterium]
MILSDRDIKRALEEGQIVVEPLFKKAIQPASVDLHLDKNFLLFNRKGYTCIDVKNPVDNLMEKIVINDDGFFIIHPGEFVLGNVYETTGVDKSTVGRLEGKSSLGRIGLIIHATAGFLDPGNKLKLTLELSNVGSLPIKLYYKMPIAQIAFEQLSSPAEIEYGDRRLNSKYYGDTEPKASMMHKNFGLADMIEEKKT